jgi:hypothetical protein
VTAEPHAPGSVPSRRASPLAAALDVALTEVEQDWSPQVLVQITSPDEQ